MKQLIMALSILGLAAASPSAALAFGGNQTNAAACDGGKLVVNVNYQLTNDYDSAVGGNAWANDTVNRQLQVRQLSDNQFCATVSDTGSFVTFAGASAAGTGTVAAGIKGQINGGYRTTEFTGTLNPSPAYASKGQLGSFDLMCTDAYTCPGVHPSYASYFSSTSGDDLAWWGWHYQTPKNGTWVNASDGNSGDITSQ